MRYERRSHALSCSQTGPSLSQIKNFESTTISLLKSRHQLHEGKLLLMNAERLSDQLADAHISGEVFRAIADCTYDWESWLSPEGKLLWVNGAVERMTGYLPEQCLQMEAYPLPLVADRDQQRVSDFLRDARSGGCGNDFEFRIVHRNGSERWMAVSWQPMYDLSRRNLGFRTSIRDIAERHQLREELRLHNEHLEQLVQERTARIAQLEQQRLQMEKLAALGQLAAGVAHEVNNPLAGIRNAFALFKSNLSPDDEHFELLELIDREIERISAITHQMYQLYRPSQQSPSKFDLERCIYEVVALLNPLATKANVQIDIVRASSQANGTLADAEIISKEGEVKQILLNLVRNAIQASSAGRTVTVQFATTASQAQLNVIDQGHGISDEHLLRIFEPFFSTKATTPKQGMGLGLSVSKSLTEALGGWLGVNSEPTKGSTFTLILPREFSDRVTSTSNSKSAERGRTHYER
jgi:two-component system, sporulation sensor kinase C